VASVITVRVPRFERPPSELLAATS
jgi:hypothetical protein